MKEPISGATSGSATETPHPRRARMANTLKLFAAVLVVGVLLSGFIVLFTNRHPAARHPGTSGSGQFVATSPATDSFGWANVQTVAIANATLYASDGFHYLYAILKFRLKETKGQPWLAKDCRIA